MLRTSYCAVIAFAFALLLNGCGGGSTPGGDSKDATDKAKASGKKVIAVIPKSTAHEFWRSVGEGAEAAAKERNVEIVFKAGDPGDQPEAQLSLVRQFIAQKVDAMVLAPVHAKFLTAAVDDAKAAKIPLVIIDSGVDSDFNDYTAYVATDNKGGGAMCAQWLAEALGGKGDVLLFKYAPGSASTQDREDGFRDEIKKSYPNIKIIQEKYAGATREDALRSANELLAANPKFDGVFACNESSAVGMLQALREKGLAGKVKYVGYDTAKVLLEAVENGEMVAVAAQNPYEIGKDGVTQAVNALEGKPIDRHIEIAAKKMDKDAIKLQEELRKQEETDKKRAEEIERIKKENEKQVEEQRKQIEGK
ncbi:MAG TPA: substrate-binding domain-containing protein [Planctomycetota bacterium]|nr:substrate-binding domain-containing protein [Planctomycetota bacterium]